MRNILHVRAVLVAISATSLALFSAAGRAQTNQTVPVRPLAIDASSSDLPELRQWDGFVDQGVRDRRLARRAVYEDPTSAGRRVEALVQHHGGVEVHGGDLSRISARGVTVAVLGKFFEDIDISLVPTLSEEAARTAVESQAATGLPPQERPTLVILPHFDGTYRLAYRATALNAVTYFVDAHSGGPLLQHDERTYQSAVGNGVGVLGDTKKVSATSRTGRFIALDSLRPAPISTLDSNNSFSAFNRLSSGGPALDSDYASTGNNDWRTGAVVDAHVHTGWTYDYFFRRHQYRGLDDQNGPIVSTVNSSAVFPNNAFFISPPFGPNGGPGLFYGTTTSGNRPFTPLDIVGHEYMHGVTFFSLRRRTGTGLGSAYILSTGPTGCAAPFWCSGDRYVVASNHSGAINEGLSDIFGTAVEFMFQPMGEGHFKADYFNGEDLGDGRSGRPLADPGAVAMSVGGVYPDHRANEIVFPIIFVPNGPLLCGGQRCDLFPRFISGNRVIAERPYVNGQGIGQTDSGAVHLNMTILSHAYYLAIEGGSNRTSGRAVEGVGHANREAIERVFFVAVRDLLPRSASFSDMASALRQAATSLYGGSSSAARAIDQALTAVGL